MKKYLLFMLLILASCKNITYKDVNPTKVANSTRLPRLDTIVDVKNLEATYSEGADVSQANGFGAVNLGHNDLGVWTQLTSTSENHYKDTRVNDIINLFDKEVKDNISTPYGERKGYISLRIGYRGSKIVYAYPVVSFMTLGIANLLGLPANKVKEDLEIEVMVMNNKKEVIKRYIENASNYNYFALYYGYSSSNVYRKVAADNIRQALEKIRYKIGKDTKTIADAL